MGMFRISKLKSGKGTSQYFYTVNCHFRSKQNFTLVPQDNRKCSHKKAKKKRQMAGLRFCLLDISGDQCKFVAILKGRK
jgi:hypothetical protein